jgi:hypothetical protein
MMPPHCERDNSMTVNSASRPLTRLSENRDSTPFSGVDSMPTERGKITVTPEMVTAGVKILWSYNKETDIGEDVVRLIFAAMENARRAKRLAENASC